MRVAVLSLTERGRGIAERLSEALGFESRHSDLAANLQELWPVADGLVFCLAAGATVRMIAPFLESKASDPAVVCVDESAGFAVSLVGGHSRRANDLAREVAAAIGATPVITTATDSRDMPALDTLPGYRASGDLAGVTRAILDGRPLVVENPSGWPVPLAIAALADQSQPDPDTGTLPGTTPRAAPGATRDAARIVITDSAPGPAAGNQATPDSPGGVAYLHPQSLVAGIGASTNLDAEELAELLAGALQSAGLAHQSVAAIATIDRRADHPDLGSLGLDILSYSADELSAVRVPSPSTVVQDAVGTPSVAEAAALLGAGPGAELLVTKTASRTATVAIARRARRRGRVRVVGIGPGSPLHRTPAAAGAIRTSEVLIGYSGYLDLCADLVSAHHDLRPYPLGAEMERCADALDCARSGRDVALVCSGDPGIYAMASPLFELAAGSDMSEVDIEVVPGITAASASAALLGAPLGHDHAVMSLSDLLTPWEVIERRLSVLAESDMAIVLYNPRSSKRTEQFERALAILRAGRPPGTPAGLVTSAQREGQQVVVTTLERLDPESVTMSTCVVVGSPATFVAGGRMVTPRGYP